jgi:predicted transglutaminase-like cysteine proteinase
MANPKETKAKKKPATKKNTQTKAPKATTAAPKAPPPKASYTPLNWDGNRDILLGALRHMRRHFIWTSDMANYGKVEDWRIPELEGGKIRDDCDGFALYCYNMLEEDMPSLRKSVYPMVCLTPGGWHMVLAVETDKGIRCMDNRQDGMLNVRQLQRQGYESFYRPQAGQPITNSWEAVSA